MLQLSYTMRKFLSYPLVLYGNSISIYHNSQADRHFLEMLSQQQHVYGTLHAVVYACTVFWYLSVSDMVV